MKFNMAGGTVNFDGVNAVVEEKKISGIASGSQFMLELIQEPRSYAAKIMAKEF